jgi:hypothetical protein
MSSDVNSRTVRGPVDVEAADPLDGRLDDPSVFAPPADWTLSGSWERAQTEDDLGGPAATPGYRRVLLTDSTTAHRVLFAIADGELRAECDCRGWVHREWCAHVASLWWRWSRGRIDVRDLDTGRVHGHPPAWLRVRGEDA